MQADSAKSSGIKFSQTTDLYGKDSHFWGGSQILAFQFF